MSKELGGRGNTIRNLQRRLQKAGLTYYAASIVSFQNTQTMDYPIESNYLVGVLSKYPIKTVKRGTITCDASANANPPEPVIRKAITAKHKERGGLLNFSNEEVGRHKNRSMTSIGG